MKRMKNTGQNDDTQYNNEKQSRTRKRWLVVTTLMTWYLPDFILNRNDAHNEDFPGARKAIDVFLENNEKNIK